MHHTAILDKLERNAAVFGALLSNLPEAQARWKPAPEKWSLLEITCHLVDEEVLDFRQRMEFALGEPDQPWQRIAPLKWVEDHQYDQKAMAASLENFLAERQTSVRFLKDSANANWSASDNYPFGNPLTAEQILANWLAHDYLHIRQINVVNRAYLAQLVPSIDLGYAGNW